MSNPHWGLSPTHSRGTPHIITMGSDPLLLSYVVFQGPDQWQDTYLTWLHCNGYDCWLFSALESWSVLLRQRSFLLVIFYFSVPLQPPSLVPVFPLLQTSALHSAPPAVSGVIHHFHIHGFETNLYADNSHICVWLAPSMNYKVRQPAAFCTYLFACNTQVQVYVFQIELPFFLTTPKTDEWPSKTPCAH